MRIFAIVMRIRVRMFLNAAAKSYLVGEALSTTIAVRYLSRRSYHRTTSTDNQA